MVRPWASICHDGDGSWWPRKHPCPSSCWAGRLFPCGVIDSGCFFPTCWIFWSKGSNANSPIRNPSRYPCTREFSEVYRSSSRRTPSPRPWSPSYNPPSIWKQPPPAHRSTGNNTPSNTCPPQTPSHPEWAQTSQLY